MRVDEVKIYNLTEKSKMYTSNVYLVTGTWNALGDVNGLVDAGRDLSILEMILEIPTGVGKKPVERVIITHNHYDHTSMLSNVKKVFRPEVYAFSGAIDEADRKLNDGDTIKMGDRIFEVIHAPGHSSDSVFLYNEEDGVLFSGDNPVMVRNAGTSYDACYVKAFEKLCRRDVRVIYPGHGSPVRARCNEMLRESLGNIKSIVDEDCLKANVT